MDYIKHKNNALFSAQDLVHLIYNEVLSHNILKFALTWRQIKSKVLKDRTFSSQALLILVKMTISNIHNIGLFQVFFYPFIKYF